MAFTLSPPGRLPIAIDVPSEPSDRLRGAGVPDFALAFPPAIRWDFSLADAAFTASATSSSPLRGSLAACPAPFATRATDLPFVGATRLAFALVGSARIAARTPCVGLAPFVAFPVPSARRAFAAFFASKFGLDLAGRIAFFAAGAVCLEVGADALPFDLAAGFPLLAERISDFLEVRLGDRGDFWAKPVLDLAFST